MKIVSTHAVANSLEPNGIFDYRHVVRVEAGRVEACKYSKMTNPSVLRKESAIELTYGSFLLLWSPTLTATSYDVSQQLHTSLVYPLRSCNGSTIVICGLDTGLRIIWRGGRPFKTKPVESRHSNQSNGVTGSEIMVIDSDEEKDASTANMSGVEFEGQYPEIDPDEPYETILRTLDIPLPSVTHLSFPSVQVRTEGFSDQAHPPILRQRMVVAAACNDYSVVLVTLPLAPPLPTVRDLDSIGVQIVKLSGHTDLIASISITHTSVTGAVTARSRSRSKSGVTDEAQTDEKEWFFLIASSSATAGGLLLIHELGTSNDDLQYDSNMPVQRQYLRSGTGCKVSFNPSVCPSPRHSNLIVIFPSGVAKVYQCMPEQNVRNPRSRRSSVGTLDSGTSRASSRLPEGKFLVTLYAPFAPAPDKMFPPRKKVIDAGWVIGGAAILALLEDGCWGIWDLEGVLTDLPKSSDGFTSGENTQPAVISGEKLTQLSIKGRVSALSCPTTRGGDKENRPTKLAPMTPHTRKLKSDGLFSKPASSFPPQLGLGAVNEGGISVLPRGNGTRSVDESVLLFYGKQNIFIPSLCSYLQYQSQLKGDADAFDSSPALARPIAMTNISLPSQLAQTSISHLQPPSQPLSISRPPNLTFAMTSAPPDILVTTPYHLIFLCKTLAEPNSSDDHDVTDDSMSDDHQEDNDQSLLTRGELDIDAMDRILDGMSNRSRPGTGVDETPTRNRGMETNGRRIIGRA